jgi:hypothetical protein
VRRAFSLCLIILLCLIICTEGGAVGEERVHDETEGCLAALTGSRRSRRRRARSRAGTATRRWTRQVGLGRIIAL